jgi:hypothetical protein
VLRCSVFHFFLLLSHGVTPVVVVPVPMMSTPSVMLPATLPLLLRSPGRRPMMLPVGWIAPSPVDPLQGSLAALASGSSGRHNDRAHLRVANAERGADAGTAPGGVGSKHDPTESRLAQERRGATRLPHAGIDEPAQAQIGRVMALMRERGAVIPFLFPHLKGRPPPNEPRARRCGAASMAAAGLRGMTT